MNLALDETCRDPGSDQNPLVVSRRIDVEQWVSDVARENARTILSNRLHVGIVRKLNRRAPVAQRLLRYQVLPLTASRQASPAARSSSPWRSGGSMPPSAEAALQVSVLARHLVAVELAVGVWADHDFPPFHASSHGSDLELVLSRALVNWESGTLVVGAYGVPLASYATVPPSTPPSMVCARAFDEPPPLLRVAADCARSRRDGRLGPPLTRVGEDDARHRRAQVTRQRRIRTSGRCTGAGRSCGLRAD